MTIDVRPLSPNLGAEILGADLTSDADFDLVRQAFADHGVIAIRNAGLTPDEHIAFAERWGEINVNRFFKPLDSHPRIATVLKEPDHTDAVGEEWHTDHSYDTVPAMGSLLKAVDLPPVGGDTLFASMHAAYRALSPGFREMLDGLKAWHSSRHAFGTETEDSEKYRTGRLQRSDAATQDACHPVVITHPLSGRRGLYVNPVFTTHIDGWSMEESDALLSFLYAHCKKPEFTCRLRWEDGTLAIWDNRATWHKALNDYHGHRRLMHRITIEGVPLA